MANDQHSCLCECNYAATADSSLCSIRHINVANQCHHSSDYNLWMSFNRTKSRAVTGLLTGHKTLRRHLHLMGLLDSPLCRRCGAEDETSAHILCECEALASLRHAYLGSFFLEPEDIWNFSKATGPP
jgi:hypothetical protein